MSCETCKTAVMCKWNFCPICGEDLRNKDASKMVMVKAVFEKPHKCVECPCCGYDNHDYVYYCKLTKGHERFQDGSIIQDWCQLKIVEED